MWVVAVEPVAETAVTNPHSGGQPNFVGPATVSGGPPIVSSALYDCKERTVN